MSFVQKTAVVAGMCAASALACAEGVIEGRVINTTGDPEAGVWVIAETDALPTDYRKIVVTDDAGRFLLPELPEARYELWVRGYGLADSGRSAASPGERVTLSVGSAEDPGEAALVYPANYWLALATLPGDTAFAASAGPYTSRAAWKSQFKLNCILCHQVGSAATRLPNAEAFDHGLLKAAGMNWFADALGRERLLGVLGPWGESLAAGAVPAAPPRPRGLERNLVITQWGWGDAYTYAHDEVATDKRDPTRYAHGRVWGVDLGNDYLLWVDPVKHEAGRIAVPTRDGFDTPWCEQTYKPLEGDVRPFGFGSLGCPWPGGVTPHAGRYDNPANPHNPMLDRHGRVWMTSQIRRQWAEDTPAFCRDAPVIMDHPHHRQLAYYDTATGRFALVDTCYGTHHLQFDDDGVLWLSGDDYVIGWLDTNVFDPDAPASLERAHGFSEVTVDSDGDGAADTPLVGFHYGIIPNHVDGSVWTAAPPGIVTPPGEPGRIHRYDRAGDRHEAYVPPAPGYGPRGIDVDSKGRVWTALAGSGHLARFDRSRCAQTWGTGAQCPEGWTLWPTPGPRFAGAPPQPATQGATSDGGADMHYYLWVDRFDTLGLGPDTVIVNGTGSDSLVAFEPGSETFTVIRIPYPLNTYTRGLDGRIDDLQTGWKGRGLWFTNGLDPIVHSEVPRSYAGKVQLRPDPLAR